MRLVIPRRPVSKPAARPVLVAILSLVVTVAGLGCLAGPATASIGRTAAGRHPHGPALLPRADTRLADHATRGAAAIRALGSHLDDAAARNGMSASRLQGLLAHDSTAWVDRTGRLYFKEAPVPAAVTATASTSQTSAATVADVFALHSRPTSTHTIYLNFTGMYVGNTAWNSTTVPARNYSGFSLDGDYSTFSSTERADIQEIWERVAAAYAPFDVDVTTQAPASTGAFTRSSSSDPTYGVPVLIDSSSADASTVCGGPCAGVAYVGTFGTDATGQYSPAWVFPSGAGGSIDYVAQSAEHEAGHTFGLVHDGIVNSDQSYDTYYGGHGMWGPIMGGGDARAVFQFNDGDYPGAKIQSTTMTYQDDLGVIAQSAPLLPDDAGDTTATATDLGDRTDYATTGMIGTRADVDVFRITRTCTGTFTVSANPTVQNSPLDIGLSVLDSAGASVAAAAPASYAGGTSNEPLAMAMGASVAPSLGAGTYYVRVEGVGNGDTTTGYSDYGSVGAYQLTASGCPATTTPTAPTAVTTGGSTGTPTGSTAPPATTTGSTGSTGSTGITGGPGSVTTGGTGTTPSPSFTPAPAPLRLAVDRTHRRLTVSWNKPDVPPAGTTLLGWQVTLLDETAGTAARRTVSAGTLHQTFGSLRAGRYAVQLRSSYSDGTGATSTMAAAMPEPVRAGSPRSVHGHRGARGGALTARATWWAPASVGSYPITGYQVQVLHLDGARVLSGRLLRIHLGAASRAVSVTAGRAGTWSFRVRALTAAGASAWSAPSAAVRAR